MARIGADIDHFYDTRILDPTKNSQESSRLDKLNTNK